MTTTSRPGRWRAALLALLLVALSGCRGGDDGVVRWRDLTLVPPSGWVVFEQGDVVLSLADAELGGEGERGQRAVAAQFTHEPDTVPDDWRRFVADQGGALEVDEAISVDGLPATRLVFAFTTNEVPTREMVVLVPSRGLVMLFQPVIEGGETDGPERFLDRRDAFDAIVDSIDFGAPRG